MAEKVGEDKAVNVLSQTLQEEKDTDVKLSKLADKMTIEEGSENEATQSSKLRPSKGKLRRHNKSAAEVNCFAASAADLFSVRLLRWPPHDQCGFSSGGALAGFDVLLGGVWCCSSCFC